IREQEINVKNVMELDSKKVLYGRGLWLCKKALNIAVMNGFNTVLENILQRFIDEQALAQNKTVSEQELDQAGSFTISNPSQHKGRGLPANKRYLLAIENYNSNNVSSNNQDEDSESRPKKKNKCQCAICKS
ncbi:4267_t:CDS:1, partial [Gigaspora rosea]